jgi:hypothetical protein
MKRFTVIVFGWLLLISCVSAEDFNIEDIDLYPLPQAAASAIYADKSFAEYKKEKCRLVGSPVDLSGDGKLQDWIVTSAYGCVWGAATGPIWILHREGNIYSVALASRGQSVTLGKAKQNGHRHVAISAGTAGWYSESLLKYDGTKYVFTRSRDVDLSKPEDCLKNKDICSRMKAEYRGAAR